MRGRQAIGEMFAKIVKLPVPGGTCGLKVTTEHTFVVGDVVNCLWGQSSVYFGPIGKAMVNPACVYELPMATHRCCQYSKHREVR